ncbi:MAG: YceI family protein [Chitinophagaceae bacterium]|nr:MAG: YceI family protein [Chitinophagaceae bacterium]
MKSQTLILVTGFLLSGLLLSGFISNAQERYFTKTGTIRFFASTDLEDVEATNKIVTAVLDIKSGAIQFSAPMKAFEFRKGLMQEHFNENYVESNKYPNSTFKGKITNNADIKYGTPGTYVGNVEGDLTIHGVTKPVSAKARIVISQKDIEATTSFNVQVADYNISIPALVANKISKTVKIDVATKLEPFTR